LGVEPTLVRAYSCAIDEAKCFQQALRILIMWILTIFLSAFWPSFVGALVGASIVWFIRRSSGRLIFLNPKSFSELVGYSKETQTKVLHDVSFEASRRWVSFVPVAVFAFFVATGAALGPTLRKTAAVPNPLMVTITAAMIFAGLGGWLALALTTRYVRPFLRAYLEKSQNVTP
jgi:hypothetical protein